MIRIGATEEQILRDLSDRISEKLNSVGVFSRVFSRIKSKGSIEKKLKEKEVEYSEKGKKMQDVFGIRVTLYFLDDEEISINLVKGVFEEIPDSHSVDPLKNDQFGPVRKNLVFRIPKNFIDSSSLFDQEFIDSSFEVQFRTVFSEGWHEVEHDLRYKCKSDWEEQTLLSRQLNGQLAVLETSDWAMIKIFDELAYIKYKNKEWNSFFRNVMRIRFEDTDFSPSIIEILNTKNNLAKEIVKQDRKNLMAALIMLKTKISLKMDHVIFIINRAIINDPDIINLETDSLKSILNETFSNA